MEKLDIPQGTLDLMILTILTREPLHGYGISQRLAVLSRDQFRVNPGSLFPSLYRLEQDGKLKAEWRATENNRRAKYYRLTAAGQRQLEQPLDLRQRPVVTRLCGIDRTETLSDWSVHGEPPQANGRRCRPPANRTANRAGSGACSA